MMYDVHCVIRHTLPALWTRQPARVGQPAQFDPAVMAASTRAMEQKANMGAGNLGTAAGRGRTLAAFFHHLSNGCPVSSHVPQ